MLKVEVRYHLMNIYIVLSLDHISTEVSSVSQAQDNTMAFRPSKLSLQQSQDF